MDKLWLPGQLATFSWSSFPVPVTLAEVAIVNIRYGENHKERSEGTVRQAGLPREKIRQTSARLSLLSAYVLHGTSLSTGVASSG